MASSTSDKEEEFIPTTLNPVEDAPREEASLLRLLPQGYGSKLDSDTIRGEVPTDTRFNKHSGDIIARLLAMF